MATKMIRPRNKDSYKEFKTAALNMAKAAMGKMKRVAWIEAVRLEDDPRIHIQAVYGWDEQGRRRLFDFPATCFLHRTWRSQVVSAVAGGGIYAKGLGFFDNYDDGKSKVLKVRVMKLDEEEEGDEG